MISGCDVAETVPMKNVLEDTHILISNAATISGIFLAIPSIAAGEAYPTIDLLGANMYAIAAFSYTVWGVK